LEAAWKYIIIGSFGLVLALLGTIFLYAAAAGNAAAPLPSLENRTNRWRCINER
jgi:NADH:ubiquinone oxidoreductase subunit 2 (subunit N)